MNPDDIKVIGNCDICKAKPAVYWYGSTSAAICESSECTVQMDERYERHCEEMERQFELEKEMKEIYGDSDEY